MSAYLIFVIVLTVAYLLYYAVIIVQDLYGKKDEVKSNEEVFDVSSMDDGEESVAVSESDTGFSIGDSEYQTNVNVITEKEETSSRAKDEQQSRFERMKAAMEENMEQMETALSNPCSDEELRMAILSGGKLKNNVELKWLTTKSEL